MKRIIPPVLFLGCIGLMIGIKKLLIWQQIFFAPLNNLGIVLILAGLLMIITVAGQFRKHRTEINTFGQPRQLVTKGLFRISRNPIYLGFSISLLGVWALLGTMLPIFGVVIFILISNYWYIPHEEEKLKQAFGAEYEIYKSKVRRWI